MQNYYVRFGRRHPIPSTVEILDELRSGYVPGYVRKSWAQYGFVKPGLADARQENAQDETSDPSITRQDHHESSR
jgi:hypothetical protein